MALRELASSASSSAAVSRLLLQRQTQHDEQRHYDKPHRRQPSTTSCVSVGLQLAASKASMSILVAGTCFARKARCRRGVAVGKAASVIQQQTAKTEAASLEQAAARLRAEAAEFEAERRRRCFSEFDVDGSGGIDVVELQLGMKRRLAMELKASTARTLLSFFDKNLSGELEFDEFDLKLLQSTALARDREEDLAKKQAEKESGAEEKAAIESPQTLPGENQDDGLLVRLACALAYLLPVLDGLQYGLPLCAVFPQLLAIVAPLAVLLSSLEQIPFGSLIFFLVIQYLSRQQWVPALLRYNLCQAVDLDIRICLFGLFLQLAPMLVEAFVPLSEESIEAGMITTQPTTFAILLVCLGILLATLVFLPFIVSIIYSITWSMFGYVPRSIPMVSQEAERIMGLPQETGKDNNNDSDTKV